MISVKEVLWMIGVGVLFLCALPIYLILIPVILVFDFLWLALKFRHSRSFNERH